MKGKLKNYILGISLFFILLGAILFSFYPILAPYILTLGVVGYGAVVFTSPYPGKSLRGKRLFNIQVLTVLLMAAACFLLFAGYNLWVPLLLISAILMLYSSHILSKEWEKEQSENKN